MKIENYNKYYIQGSDHYLIPKDVFKELFNEMVNWREESQKQKEVIDKLKHILNNQINYREFVDMINDIEDILKEGQNE